MSTEIQNILRYFIRYEEYSRFMNSSLNSESIDGEHLHEDTLTNQQYIQDTLEKKQRAAVIKKLKQYSEFKNFEKFRRDKREKWSEAIRSVVAKERGINDIIDELPFKYPDNRDNFKSYVTQLLMQEQFTLCYPLMIKEFTSVKKKKIERPVFTFNCTITEEGLRVNSFVMNRASLEVFLAQGLGCEIEDVRLIAAPAYSELCTKIDSIKSTQIKQILSMVDQAFREAIPYWNCNSLLNFKGYNGWIMNRRLFITKEQLEEVKESIFRKELERLHSRQAIFASSLVEKYLLGNKRAADYTLESPQFTHHHGSYTAEYPVNIKQWRTIQSLQHAQLLAVNGPPGTGKTTLIKEMIADTLVKKAMLLIDIWDQPWELIDEGQIRAYYQSPLGGKNPFSMVITSTNNKAVNNIGNELSQEIEYLGSLLNDHAEETVLLCSDEEEGDNSSGFISSDQIASELIRRSTFCARLGNMDNMDEFRNNLFDKIMKGLEHPNIDSLHDEDIRSAFVSSLNALEELHQKIDLYWSLLQLCIERGELEEQIDINTTIKNKKREVEKLSEEIEYLLQKQKELLQSKLITGNEKSNYEQQVQQLKIKLKTDEEKRRQAYADKESLLKLRKFPTNLFNFLPKRKLFLSENPTVEFIQDTRIAPVNQEITECEEQLQQSSEWILRYQAEMITIEEELNHISIQIQTLEENKEELKDSTNRLEELLQQDHELKKELCLQNIVAFCSYYELVNAPIILKLRNRIFIEALAVNEQYVLKHHTEMRHNLEKIRGDKNWFQSFYSENGSRLDQYEKGIRALWESFFLCFPVATTTLHSFSERFFQPLHGLIDTLLVDEAGQIMPHYLCAPLYRTQKAVIVGDPEQLEPVRPFTINLIEESDVQEDIQDRICLLKNSAQDYADRGSEYFECMGKKKKGIILNEHRRCEASIMRFSNTHVYNEMLILTKADLPDKLFGSNLVAFDIRGLKEAHAHLNFTEITACQKIVNILTKRYGDNILNDIGIITPFSSQAKELANVVTGVDIGTVHTFQGKEKRFIIFSAVIDGLHPKHAGLSYVIGNTPNMLNVAFSRAKEQFIYVGNIETGLASGNYLAKAIKIIQQYGAVYSIFNKDYEDGKFLKYQDEAYAVYHDHLELDGIDQTFVNDMNKHLNANVLMTPKSHYAVMLQALEYCQSTIGIVSPWMTSSVMNEKFFSLVKAATERQVGIQVRFGYSSSRLTINEIDKIVERDYYNYRNKDAIKETIEELYRQLGENLKYMPPLHTKVLLVDGKILFIGSHNWLSNNGKQGREEISYLITNKQTIEYVKKRFQL